MANYSIVNIDHGATTYKVYWDQKKHNHDASTATGKWAMEKLAAHVGCEVKDLDYRPKSFQSNQSKAPAGKNTFEIS